MDKSDVLSKISAIAIIPVVRVGSADDAVAAVEAIAEGGIPIAEITMTVPDAIGVIARLVSDIGDGVLVGAGTVFDADAAKACIDAGASFVVSPSLELDVIETCRNAGVAVFPGALTPSEIRRAWAAGADAVKVFPCNAMGGASYIRSLRGPMPHIPLMPTGGVSLENAADFLKAGVFAMGVGGELVSSSKLRTGDRSSIVEAARAYVDLVREVRG